MKLHLNVITFPSEPDGKSTIDEDVVDLGKIPFLMDRDLSLNVIFDEERIKRLYSVAIFSRKEDEFEAFFKKISTDYEFFMELFGKLFFEEMFYPTDGNVTINLADELFKRLCI